MPILEDAQVVMENFFFFKNQHILKGVECTGLSQDLDEV